MFNDRKKKEENHGINYFFFFYEQRNWKYILYEALVKELGTKFSGGSIVGILFIELIDRSRRSRIIYKIFENNADNNKEPKTINVEIDWMEAPLAINFFRIFSGKSMKTSVALISLRTAFNFTSSTSSSRKFQRVTLLLSLLSWTSSFNFCTVSLVVLAKDEALMAKVIVISFHSDICFFMLSICWMVYPSFSVERTFVGLKRILLIWSLINYLMFHSNNYFVVHPIDIMGLQEACSSL